MRSRTSRVLALLDDYGPLGTAYSHPMLTHVVPALGATAWHEMSDAGIPGEHNFDRFPAEGAPPAGPRSVAHGSRAPERADDRHAPVRSGRYLLITQVENGGLMLALNPDRPAARVVWTGANPNRTDRPVQRSMTSTPIVLGDAIYGLNSYGELRGVDGTTGERLWSSDQLVPEDRWPSSHLVQHQDRSFISVETGELVIARFTPAGYEEVDRTHC